MAKWDLKKALNVCRAFEEIGIEWIEEPLYGYDFEGLAELRKRTTLHVAGGELNAQVHEYRDLIKHNCFDIYQMDVVLSGGFVQNRKVAAMAEAENKIYTPTPGLMVWVWPPHCIWRALSATAPSSSTATILPTGPTRCVT